MSIKQYISSTYPNSNWYQSSLIFAITIAIFSFPILFLSVRHGIHVALFFLCLLALIDLARNLQAYWVQIQEKKIALIFFSTSSLFIGTLISQTLQGTIKLPEFDGPSKILCAGFIFLLLIKRGISPIKIIELAIPISSIVLLAVLIMNPETSQFWGGRLASKFVDPNSMGSQTMILGLASFFLIRPFKEEKWYLMALKIMSGVIFIYISIFAGSRGGWLTFLPIVMLWLALKVFDDSKEHKLLKRVLIASAAFIAVLITIFLLYRYQSFFNQRITSAYLEIQNWWTGQNTTSSAGNRLTMWKISFSIIQESPIYGFGTTRPIELITSAKFNVPGNQQAIHDFTYAGPHSDIAAKLLGGGIIGLTTYFATLVIPGYFFWKNKSHKHTNSKISARLGLYYIIGVFFCGLANEMLSMKYLSSFYGLMVTCLLAETLKNQSSIKK